jgi:hypothetical protein
MARAPEYPFQFVRIVWAVVGGQNKTCVAAAKDGSTIADMGDDQFGVVSKQANGRRGTTRRRP